MSENNHSINSIKMRRRKLLLTMGVAIVLYILVAESGWLVGQHLSWWSDFAWTVASLAAGLRCLKTARSRTMVQERKAWTMFGIAALSWFVGMLIWDYYEIFGGQLVPFPSVGDYFFMGYALFFIVGLIYYRTQVPTRQYNLIQIANLGLIVNTIILVCFILLSQALQQSDNSLDYELYALGHAILTIVCFVFAVYCYWFYVWKENHQSFRLMIVALGIFAFTDTLYAFELLGQSFNASSYLNVYWLIAMGLHYWSAFEQDAVQTTPEETIDASGTPRSQRYEAIMPALCLFTALIFSLYFRDRLDETTYNVMIATSILFALFLTLREWYSNTLEANLFSQIKNAKNKLEKRVKMRTRELSNANEELRAFNYSVSHDLRAPLRSINGFSQVLLEDYDDQLDETGRNYLHRVCDATKRMDSLINSLLVLSRVTQKEIQRKEVNLSKLASEVISCFREQEPERDVKISIAEGVTALGDEHLLKNVLENLLGNAWKYTGRTKNPCITFDVAQRNGQTIYCVADNGAGFDMKYADKLFGAFQRLHTEEYEGTGVGLATVKRIIRRHGGDIWVDAKVNVGAKFFFTLPTADWISHNTQPDASK